MNSGNVNGKKEPGSSFQRGNNWYYRDWEWQKKTQPNGKKRKIWVYTGTYYDLQPMRLRLRLRTVIGVSTLLLVIVWLRMALSSSAGALTAYVEYPCIFAALPLLYYSMGSFWFAATSGKMTYRRYYASVLRMRTAGYIGLVFMAATALGEIIFLCFHFQETDLFSEIFYLIGALFCVGQYYLGVAILRRYPMQECK